MHLLVSTALSRIDFNPARLPELTDDEIKLAEQIHQSAGVVLATELYRLMGRDGEKTRALLAKALKRSERRISIGTRKAKRALDSGKRPKPSQLADLLIWCRAEHDVLIAEQARREARGATLQ